MRANERKTYIANSNTNNNRFFNDNQPSRGSMNHIYNRSMKGSITSGKSFLAKVREEPEEQNLDSGSNFNQNYGKIYADLNKNFKEKSFNLNFNSNNNSNSTPGFFSAKNKDNNTNSIKEDFTHIENLRYRDNNEFIAAKFRERGFDYAVREDIMNQAAKTSNHKEKSYFEKLAIEMIYKINFKALENKKHIFDSGKLANFLSNQVMTNSFEEKKQKEILDFLKSFNPDENFVKSLPQSEIRNFNLRYSNAEMLEILQQILKSNPNSNSNLSYNDLLQLSKKNEILQIFKKGKKAKLDKIACKDVELNGSGVYNTASHFNLFNYNFNSRDVNDEREDRKWGSNSCGNKDEMLAKSGVSSESKNNSLNKDLKSTTNHLIYSGLNLIQNKNYSQKNYTSNHIIKDDNNNIHPYFNTNTNYIGNRNNHDSNKINKNTLISNLKKFNLYLQSEIKSECFKNKDALKKHTLFNAKSLSSQLNENNKSINSALSNSRNNSNSNSKDLGVNSNSNNNKINMNFESASKKNVNYSLNPNLNSNKNNNKHNSYNLNNVKIANNNEKLSISNTSSAKKKRFKLNRLRKFDESELLEFQRKLHENLSNIDILNKNLMNDCRHNYDFLLNNSKTNFLKESDRHNFFVKQAIEIIPLAKRFEILERSGEIPMLELTVSDTQALNQCFNRFSIISQNFVLTQKDKISNTKNFESNDNLKCNRRYGENSNYNAHRIMDNLNQGISSYNFINNVNNYNKDLKGKGFNASEAFKKNPFFNKQLGLKSVDNYDYNDLINRKNLLLSARANMQIMKQIKVNDLNLNSNNTNSKTQSENKGNLALNNEKLVVNNFNNFNDNNNNNYVKKNEEEGLNELNRNLQGAKSNFAFVDNFNPICKENIEEQKNNFLKNSNKVENNFNLLGQSPINFCFAGNSIKNHNIPGKSGNNLSANESSVNSANKNLHFEINNCYFSLNTVSKRNNVFKESKSILVNESKNNEKEKEEENKQKIFSKAFSFKNNNSKASPFREQMEDNSNHISNAQINEIKNNLSFNYNILKTSEKVNESSDSEKKHELLTNNFLINPQMKTNKNRESSNLNVNHDKDNKTELISENNMITDPGKKEASILSEVKNNNVTSDSNNFAYLDNLKNQSENNIKSKAQFEPVGKVIIKPNENKEATEKQEPNEIKVIRVNEKAVVDPKFKKINESINEINDATNKNFNIETKHNLNSEATLPSGTSSTTIFSHTNNLDITSTNNKINNPILNAISNNQNTNLNLITPNNEASNSNNTAIEQKSNLKSSDQLNSPLISNVEDIKKDFLSNQIPQTSNITITTIGLNSEKSLVNNSNPFLQKLNSSNTINKVQPNSIVNNNAQVPTNINNSSTNNNPALSSNIFTNNNINKNQATNDTSNNINHIGNNNNTNNQLNQVNNIKNDEMMDISTVNVNNIITNGFNNNLNSNTNTFFNSNINNTSKQNNALPNTDNSFNSPLLINPSNNPITLNNGVDNNLNNFNVNNNLSFNNNMINNNAKNLNNPMTGLGQIIPNMQNPLISNNNLILTIPMDSDNSFVKPNNPFVVAKPNIALNNNFNPINPNINNFQNNLAANNNNNNINLINTNNPFVASNFNKNNNPNYNNNVINNTANLFNAINSNQNNNQINSNFMLNNNNNPNNIVNNNTNNNINSNPFNSAPINNNFNNLNNANNNGNTMFKNPFVTSGAGNQTSNVPKLNSGFGNNNNNNANSFIPKSNTGNAFIVDPNKSNKQTGSIFSNNPTNRNRSYYTKYN